LYPETNFSLIYRDAALGCDFGINTRKSLLH
jgi:hypothetical protein